MYPADSKQYESFLCNDLGHSFYVEARIGEELIAVAVMDNCINGLSSVYTFFNPDLENRSLGQFMIIKQIELVSNNVELEYLYLGYWIKNSQKMSYKSKYQPGEVYFNKRWIPLTA